MEPSFSTEASTPGTKHGVFGAISGSVSTLYERRWLIGYLVRREISKSYQSSFLGFMWAFLSPLLMVALYTLVFSQIVGLKFRVVAGDPTLNFGLYLYCGLLPFQAFSESLNQSTNTIKGNSMLVKKLVFPTEILPFTTALANMADKVFGLIVLIVIVAFVEGRLEPTLLVLPFIMALQLVFILGLCYVFSVIGTFIPDVRETLRAFTRIMFWLTPIIWPPEQVPERFKLLVDLNPLAFIVGAYRDMILEGRLPGLTATALFTAFSIAVCAGGFMLFLKTKHRFADAI